MTGSQILACLAVAATGASAETMPVAQQNALVQKYCAVCHTDAADNGGLSLEHFDAAVAAPSLTAMMLSKITGGVALDVVQEAPAQASAAAAVDKGMRSGAMGAAGIPVPDQATINELIRALATKSTQAAEWSVQRRTAGVTTVSIMHEVLSPSVAGGARAYRLVVSCNQATRQGAMQLAWSPVPRSGTLTASVDGKPAVSYPVAGSEQMGNGSSVVTSGLAALRFDLPMPGASLAFGDLFPGETVEFAFSRLPKDARGELAACFSRVGARTHTAARATKSGLE